MPVTRVIPNSHRRNLATGVYNLESDELRVALMEDNFVFDKSAHSFWSDVSDYELPNNYGYSQYLLQNPIIVNNFVYSANFGDINIIASGGDLSFKTVIVYDNSVISKPIIAALIFSTTKIIINGLSFQLKDISINIGD